MDKPLETSTFEPFTATSIHTQQRTNTLSVTEGSKKKDKRGSKPRRFKENFLQLKLPRLKRFFDTLGVFQSQNSKELVDIFEDVEVTSDNRLKIIHIPLEELICNKERNVRTCLVSYKGSHSSVRVGPVARKSILLVGETGVGKTTTLNGILNHMFGVTFGDDHRFWIADLERKDKAPLRDSTQSHTDYITAYIIPHCPGDSILPFELVVIDMPGVGDTRGIERDKELMKQVEEFFRNAHVYGIDSLDAVCILMKASCTRLTVIQRYIIDSLLSMFGADLKENILLLLTFSENIRYPLTLKMLQESNVEYVKYFLFGNAYLYTSRTVIKDMDDSGEESDDETLQKHTWEVTQNSYKKFLEYLCRMTPKSLTLSADVLQERGALLLQCQHIHKRIAEICHQIDEYRVERDEMEKCLRIIDTTKDIYTYIVDVPTSIIVKKAQDASVSTVCNVCDRTCHYPCFCNAEQLLNCLTFDKMTHKCMNCPKYCPISDHSAEKYYHVMTLTTVEKTFPEAEQLFSTAVNRKELCQKQIDTARAKYKDLQCEIIEKAHEAVATLTRLGEIALKPNPSSVDKYILGCIDLEMRERLRGYEARVRILEAVQEHLQKGDDGGLLDSLTLDSDAKLSLDTMG